MVLPSRRSGGSHRARNHLAGQDEVGIAIGGRVPHDVARVAAGLHVPDGGHEQLAHRDDGDVARGQMLLRAVLDWARVLGRPRVVLLERIPIPRNDRDCISPRLRVAVRPFAADGNRASSAWTCTVCRRFIGPSRRKAMTYFQWCESSMATCQLTLYPPS